MHAEPLINGNELPGPDRIDSDVLTIVVNGMEMQATALECEDFDCVVAASSPSFRIFAGQYVEMTFEGFRMNGYVRQVKLTDDRKRIEIEFDRQSVWP